MARRVPEQNESAELQPQNSPEAQPSAEGIPGGASGVPQDASQNIHTGQPLMAAEIPQDAPLVEVKKWRVTNDPPAGKTGYPVILDSCLTHLPKGKIVSEATYDVEKLREQGVTLEAV